MSAALQQQVLELVRTAFTRAEVAEVLPYGGEFNAGEVGQLSYSCPAVLVAVLGWRPMEDSKRLTGRNVRGVRLAAFVATKHAKREERMASAMLLAERLSLLLRGWTPTSTDAMALAPLEDDCTVENLYNRAIDAKGQALWLVDWQQAVKPLLPPAQLFDLLAVEIVDTVQQGNVPAPATPPGSLLVSEEVNFENLPPPPGPLP